MKPRQYTILIVVILPLAMMAYATAFVVLRSILHQEKANRGYRIERCQEGYAPACRGLAAEQPDAGGDHE